MTSLVELEAKFLRWDQRMETWTRDRGDGFEEQVTGLREVYTFVETIQEAQGVEFLCPKCFAENKGPIGTHAVICWSRSRGVPEHVKPGPGRWSLHGTGIVDLTLNADPPGTARSVLLTGGCGWHGYVNAGDAA